MKSVILNDLEWMTENLTEHGGKELNGNWYYTWDEAIKAVKEIGDGWRLPTQSELETLDILGYIWNKKKKGTLIDGKLFLKAAGYIGSLSDTIERIDMEGDYWSCSLYSKCIHAGALYFDQGTFDTNAVCRNYHLSVRLVRDIKK